MSHVFPRHLICGSATIYICTRHLICWPADHFTYIHLVFDMWVSDHLHTHSALNMSASKHVFDIRYYNVDLQTCVLGVDGLLVLFGRRTFHIYMHSVFDICMYWSANPDLLYIITRCLICGSATIYIHTRHFFGMHICLQVLMGRCVAISSSRP